MNGEKDPAITLASTAASSDPASVAALFAAPGLVRSITPRGGGVLGASYLVRCSNAADFLLQRLDPVVFPQPEIVLHNLRLVSAHLSHQSNTTKIAVPRQTMRSIASQMGRDFYYDHNGACWLASNLAAKGQILERIGAEKQAFAVGLALGRFHCLLHKLPPSRLYDPVPTLHAIPGVLLAYQQTAAKSAKTRGHNLDVAYCHDFIDHRKAGVAVLEQARSKGTLRERIIHGDPRLTNIFFAQNDYPDPVLIDLSAVRPGLIQYDLGDCLRLCHGQTGENRGDSDSVGVEFDLELARALLSGYLKETRALLTYSDFAYIYEAIRLLTFELGLRFFTAYLAENGHSKIDDRELNLYWALTQFQLTASIENQQRHILMVIRELT